MQERDISGVMLALATFLVFAVRARAAESKPEKKPDYLNVVQAHADALIEHAFVPRVDERTLVPPAQRGIPVLLSERY